MITHASDYHSIILAPAVVHCKQCPHSTFTMHAYLVYMQGYLPLWPLLVAKTNMHDLVFKLGGFTYPMA